MPAFLCEDELRRDELRAVLREWLPEPYPIAAVTPSHRHLSAKVRCFLDLLIELHLTLAALGDAAVEY